MIDGLCELEVTKLTWDEWMAGPCVEDRRWSNCKCGSGNCNDPHEGWVEQLRSEWDKPQVFDPAPPEI